MIASIESLKGRQGIRDDAVAPDSPEEIQDAKGYLTGQMVAGRRYSKTVDQPRFTAVFDLGQAEVCRSFVKLRAEVDKLLRHIYACEPEQ